jgi:hypothetical protein
MIRILPMVALAGLIKVLIIDEHLFVRLAFCVRSAGNSRRRWTRGLPE